MQDTDPASARVQRCTAYLNHIVAAHDVGVGMTLCDPPNWTAFAIYAYDGRDVTSEYMARTPSAAIVCLALGIRHRLPTCASCPVLLGSMVHLVPDEGEY